VQAAQHAESSKIKTDVRLQVNKNQGWASNPDSRTYGRVRASVAMIEHD